METVLISCVLGGLAVAWLAYSAGWEVGRDRGSHEGYEAAIKRQPRAAATQIITAGADEHHVAPHKGLAWAPHCDAGVLHSPGVCEICDCYSDWQHYRRVAGIAFTGHEPEEGQVPCPSDQRRGRGAAHVWPGNAPHAPGERRPLFARLRRKKEAAPAKDSPAPPG